MLLTIVFGALLVAVVVTVVVDTIRATPRQVVAATPAVSPPDAVLDWARSSLAPTLRRYGYRLVFVDDMQLVFERGWRPLVVWLVTVLLFPIGLIAFVMGRRSSPLVVAIAPDGHGGSEIRLSGEAPASLATKLATIADPP